MSLAITVANMTTEYTNKLIFDGARLQWNDYVIVLEELPAKGKKTLRILTVHVGHAVRVDHLDDFIPDNILDPLRRDVFDVRDGYDAVATLLRGKVEGILKRPHNANAAKFHSVTVSQEVVHFLKVAPEGATEERKVEFKDFTLAVSWLKFSAYSPNSDFHQADPHYTEIASTAPASARKLFKLTEKLAAEKFDFKAVGWSDLPEFLREHKVTFKYNFSQWS